jgi:hypothetical protein
MCPALRCLMQEQRIRLNSLSIDRPRQRHDRYAQSVPAERGEDVMSLVVVPVDFGMCSDSGDYD